MASPSIIRKFVLAFLSLAIIWAGITGYRILVRRGKRSSPSETALPITEVELITVKREDVFTNITGYGTVRGKREVLITPEVGGKVVSINPDFASGKAVKKGQLLFSVDTRAVEVRIDQVKGEIFRLKTQIETVKQEAENVKRNLDILADNVKLAEKEVKKNEILVRKQMIAEQILDTSRRDYLREQNSKVNYENQLAMIPLKINEIKASLAIRKAELADASLNLDKSKVKAPFNGVTYDKGVEISQVVQAGQAVGMLADISVLEIPVDLNVENISHLNFESFQATPPWKYPCTIFWDVKSDGSAQWKGYISRIEKINENSRTVRAVVEVPDGRSSRITLSKGMFCRVILPGMRYKNAISIPPSALHNDDTVYILEKKSLQIKKVAVLQRLEDVVVIGSGLTPGDRVIVSALSNPVIGMLLKARSKRRKL